MSLMLLNHTSCGVGPGELGLLKADDQPWRLFVCGMLVWWYVCMCCCCYDDQFINAMTLANGAGS